MAKRWWRLRGRDCSAPSPLRMGGAVRIVMLENVQQPTIRPLIEATIKPGTVVNADEYGIYAALPQWGVWASERVCVTAMENTPVTRRVTVSMRSLSTPWMVFGRGCVLGCARIGASPRKSCRCAWASLSSCITSDAAVGLCCGRC
jgi:hypothetical protein